MVAIHTAREDGQGPRISTVLSRLVSRAAPTAPNARDARARCAFVQEMIARNPDAFSSDFDVQAMMQLYPGRF